MTIGRAGPSEHDLDVSLTRSSRSPSQARTAILQFLAERNVDGDRKSAAALVVTELVTNAVRHGDEPIELHVDLTDGTLRVEVADSDRHVDDVHIAAGTTDSVTGRGLALVEGFSHRWGADGQADRGKTVWAELHTTQRS